MSDTPLNSLDYSQAVDVTAAHNHLLHLVFGAHGNSPDWYMIQLGGGGRQDIVPGTPTNILKALQTEDIHILTKLLLIPRVMDLYFLDRQNTTRAVEAYIHYAHTKGTIYRCFVGMLNGRVEQKDYSDLLQLLKDYPNDYISEAYDSTSATAFKNTGQALRDFAKEHDLEQYQNIGFISIGNGANPVGLVAQYMFNNVEWFPVRLARHKHNDKEPLAPYDFHRHLEKCDLLIIWEEDTASGKGLIMTKDWVARQLDFVPILLGATSTSSSAREMIRESNQEQLTVQE